MIKATLRRAYQDARVTLGILQFDLSDPFFTLENPFHQDGIDSLIPAGTYKCVPYSSAKFPSAYKVMSVPGRTDILIHVGNFESDTAGCILLGQSAGKLGSKLAVMESKAAMDRFCKILDKQEFMLTIKDPS